MKTEVRIKGTGQKNGPVLIDKTIILDGVVSSNFQGSKKEASVLAVVTEHYPGVKVEVNKLSVTTNTVV